jgi:hypothetical protein
VVVNEVYAWRESRADAALVGLWRCQPSCKVGDNRIGKNDVSNSGEKERPRAIFARGRFRALSDLS